MSKSANVNAVRVVVENVVQNPTVAYTCSGTTLSFTSAPPTGTSNIYVVHLGPPAATVAPPTTINNATTFTGGVTLKNETPEDTDGGRESIVTFQGTQSGSEISTLAQIQASHDATADDQKGDLIFKTNDGSDGTSPTEAMRIDSAQNIAIGTNAPTTFSGFKTLHFKNGSGDAISLVESDGGVISQEISSDSTGMDSVILVAAAIGLQQFLQVDTVYEVFTEMPATEANEAKQIPAKEAYTKVEHYNSKEEAPEGRIMSKARELAELGAVYDSGALSNRNMIYNGAFEIAQRGVQLEVGDAATPYEYRSVGTITTNLSLNGSNTGVSTVSSPTTDAGDAGIGGGNQPGTGVRSRFIYTATASQTTFTGADDNSKTLKYADSAYVDVFLNGVCLVPGTDYTASTKTSIVLTQAASVSDTLEVIAYDIASMSDMSASNGGTFQADVTFAAGADLLTASKGTDNVRLGENAGAAIASGGNNNVAIGKDALASNTTADNSTAVGFEAGTNSTGAQNTFLGRQSGKGVTSGTESVFVGNAAGRDGTQTGSYNIGIGSVSLNALTSATANAAIGRDSLGATTTGGYNTAVGYQSLLTNTTGSENTALGAFAGGNTTGVRNTALGKSAMEANTTGGDNVAIGVTALDANTTGGLNTAVGAFSLSANTTASDNTAVGAESAVANTTGTDIVAVGMSALRANTTGIGNVAVGRYTMAATTTGTANTAMGAYDGINGFQPALRYNTTGAANVAIGSGSLAAAVTASNNTSVGHGSLLAYTGTGATNMVAIGTKAARYASTAKYCTFVGYQAAAGVSGSALTGLFNTAIGYEAGVNLSTSGSENTFLGTYAGYYNGTSSTGNGITTGINNTAIGYAAYPSSATANNEYTLGNSHIANLRCNDTSISSLSDERDKTNIVDVPLGLDFIKTLRPVAFDWNRRDGSKQGLKDFGFIAQELKTAQAATDYADHMRLVHEGTVLVPDAENTNPTEDENGDPIMDVSGTMQECLEADPMKTYPVLVKAVQELSTALDAALARIATLEG
eukprot:gene1736-1032_t